MPLPLIAAALVPLAIKLAANGAELLGRTVLKTGAKFIEDKTGIDLSEPDNLTPENFQALKQFELENQQMLLDAIVEDKRLDVDLEKAATHEVTERAKGDMLSDSWLSKNVRPLTLVALTISVIIGSFWAAMSVDKYDAMTSLLKLVFGYYFIGRSTEKGVAKDLTKRFANLRDTVRRA